MSRKLSTTPFRVGRPIRDPVDFVGRIDVLQEISNAMLNLQNVSLRGERRTGKTSLLRYLTHPGFSSVIGLPEAHIPVYFDFQPFARASEASVWQAMAAAVAEQVKQRCPGGQVMSEKLLATMTESLASPGAPELFGTGFGQALSYLDSSGFRVHLLLDEFDQTVRNPNLGDTFYDALRSLPTRAENISYVIATRTGIAALQPSYNKVSSPFFNIFTQITLGPFNEEEAHHLIFSYFARAGLDISLAEKLCAESLFLYDMTGYHPFFLQMLCYHLYASLDEPDWPMGQARQEALWAFEKNSERHFRFYWGVSFREEQGLLKELAFHQPIDWDRLEHVAKSLQDRCLIVRTESDWQIFSSAFARWIKQLTLQTLYAKAVAQLEVGKWTEAIGAFEEIVHIDQAYKDAHDKLDWARAQSRLQNLFGQGLDYLREERWSQAIECLGAVVLEAPDYLGAVDRLKEAQKQQELAALYSAGVGLQDIGRWQEANGKFMEIIRRVGIYKDAAARLNEVQRQQELGRRFARGENCLRERKWKEAVKEFEQVYVVDPDYPGVRIGLAEGKRQLRLEELRERGEASFRDGNWQEAVKILEELRGLDPSDGGIVAKIAEVEKQLELVTSYREGVEYLRSERWREARIALEKVIRADPNYRDAARQLKIARERLGQSNPVIEFLHAPLWQGIGGVIAIIALIVAMYPFIKETFNPATPTPKPAVLCNGSFEDDFECWQHGGELRQDIECDGGQCYAVLGSPDYKCEGGVPVGEAWIKQSFQVPQTVSPTLSLRYRVSSYDLDDQDFFQVNINGKIFGPFGNTEWGEASCDLEAWDSGWQPAEFDLGPYRGRMVEVSLHNVNGAIRNVDGTKWWNTWTYVDDVEIR